MFHFKRSEMSAAVAQREVALDGCPQCRRGLARAGLLYEWSMSGLAGLAAPCNLLCHYLALDLARPRTGEGTRRHTKF